MKKLKYQIEFVRDFLKKERGITLLDENYIGSHVPIRCQCDTCQYKWSARFSNLKFGQGCPPCGKERAANSHRNSPEDIRKIFLSKSIVPLNLENYKTSKSEILCKCQKCQYEWVSNYSRIALEHKGCPNCKRYTLSLKRTLPIEVVKQELELRNIRLQGSYISAKSPLKCQCQKCGYEWVSCGLNNIKNFQVSCQNCSHLSFLSEKMCRIIMENIFGGKFGKHYIPGIGLHKKGLELDGYNKPLRLAFEHNGPQHYSPKIYGLSTESAPRKFEIQVKNDQLKKEWCVHNNITLIIFRELGKCTIQSNIISTIKTQLIQQDYPLPPNIDFYVPNFKEIKEQIIKRCSS